MSFAKSHPKVWFMCHLLLAGVCLIETDFAPNGLRSLNVIRPDSLWVQIPVVVSMGSTGKWLKKLDEISCPI